MVDRSTHNTRIERLWLESGRHFARGWRAFFTRLERLHFLDRDDPHHIWLLHTLFLEDIQHDCDEFTENWNRHPLSGKGQNMSPLVCSDYHLISFSEDLICLQDIRFLGQTQHGVYDEADDLDPAMLHRYYGAAVSQENNHSDIDSNPSSPNPNTTPSEDGSSVSSSPESDSENDSDSDSDDNPDSDSDSNPSTNPDSNPSSDSGGEASSYGDGHPGAEVGQGDELVEEGVRAGDAHTQSWEGIARTIAAAQKRNIRHDAAEVAKSTTPFEDRNDLEAYTLALHAALNSSEYPAGFGLNMEYESLESYKTGRSSKPLTIPLPHEVWFPRIVVWCKALDLLKRLPLCKAAVV